MKVLYDISTGKIESIAEEVEDGDGLAIWETNDASFAENASDYLIQNGALVRVSMERESTANQELVDTTIGEIRKKYATNIPFQDGTYIEKANEAKDYDSCTLPELAAKVFNIDYPLLYNESSRRSMTMDDLVAEVLATHSQWMTIAGDLEGIRVATKEKVRNATTDAEMNTAMSDFNVAIAPYQT